MMRLALHWLLNAIGIATWCAGMVFLYVTMKLAVLGHRVWPEADRGNCWSFALPRFHEGGYLVVRWANGVRLFGVKFPHAIWMRRIPEEAEIMQTAPVKRERGRMLPRVFYFRFEVFTKEPPK